MAAESPLTLAENRRPIEQVLAGLAKGATPEQSLSAGQRLQREARKHALSLRDYLTLAVETRGTQFSDLTGYEASLVYLNLPVKDDFKEGVVLQAASETFQTYPGTRALFPPVIDDMLYWATRMDNLMRLEDMLAGSITIDGPELLFTVVDDAGTDYNSFIIPEGARIPVRTLRTSESAVRMWKHGSGIRTTYEFSRRARLDLLTPFAARVQRELVLSKIKQATATLIGGDGNPNSAAPVVNQSSFNVGSASPYAAPTSATNGQLSFDHLVSWLVSQAANGVPVDTVIGGWDGYAQWMRLFQPVNPTGFFAPAQMIKESTGMGLTLPNLFPAGVKFVLASSVPAGNLIGIVKGETLQEIKEAGGETAEEDREILNQTITYIRTEVSGLRLLYQDTRSVFNWQN